MLHKPMNGAQLLPDNVIEVETAALTLKSRAGDVEILKDIDFTVAAGETVAIVGPSGSGKTSLLMLLGGLEQATHGRVRVAGVDMTPLDEDELAAVRAANIGIVFQSFHLVPTMTALENVALPLEFRGQAGTRERATAALREVGLASRLEHYPAQLSGGEQQRVALARALVTEPKILLADEPTGNLDGRTGRQVIEQIMSLGTRHATTLILVTHDESLARRCARTIRISDGRIAADERSTPLSGNAPPTDQTPALATGDGAEPTP